MVKTTDFFRPGAFSAIGRKRLAAVLLAVITACWAGAPAVAAPGNLIFAKVPSDGAGALLATRYANLTKSLSRALGQDVEFQTRKSYEEMANAMGRGAFDVVSVGPALYLQYEKLYEPVVRPIRYKGTSYRGIILVGANSRYQSLKDLKGARLGFVDKKSASGYLLPALMIERSGLSLVSDFAQVKFFAGKHPDVAQAVTRGDVDAGAVYEDARIDAFGVDQATIAKTRILAKTPVIPNDPIVVRRSLAPALKERIRSFFVNAAKQPDIKDLTGPLDEGIKGWVSASSADYDPVREFAEALVKAERGEQ